MGGLRILEGIISDRGSRYAAAGGPAASRAEVERLHRNWTKAVSKTLDWVDEDVR